MTTHCCESLVRYEPIAELILSVSGTPSRVHVSARHRHWSGVWADCELTVYDRLTPDEAADVILVHLATLGQPPES